MKQVDLSLVSGCFRNVGMNAFEEGIANRILGIIRGLPRGCTKLYFSRDLTKCLTLLLVPTNNTSASIEIKLYSADPCEASIRAGVGAFLSLATDIYGEDSEDWAGFLDKMVCGIVNGEFEEMVCYKGGVLIKSTFAVRLDTKLFTFTRGDFAQWLRTLLRSKEVKSISYAPYDN